MEEQKRLMASMNPSLLEWIRAKKTAATSASSVDATRVEPIEAMEVMEDNHDDKEVAAEDKSTPPPPKQEEEAGGPPSKPLSLYPGMSVLEEGKLSWTGDLPPLPPASGLQNFSARFGLEGKLLPPDLEVPVQVS